MGHGDIPKTRPPRRNTGRLVGITLLLLLVLGVATYSSNAYRDQQVWFTHQAMEKIAANNAIDTLEPTCFSDLGNESIDLPVPSLVLHESLGVYNPTDFPMQITWQLDYGDHYFLSKVHFGFPRLVSMIDPMAQPTFGMILSRFDGYDPTYGADHALAAVNTPTNITFLSQYNVTGAYGSYTFLRSSSFFGFIKTAPEWVLPKSSGNLPKCGQ